jgi:hypothetical protein
MLDHTCQVRRHPLADRGHEPPNTRPPQTRHELRTASLPFAAFVAYCRVRPLKRTALLAKPMNGINPEPDAFWQSEQ